MFIREIQAWAAPEPLFSLLGSDLIIAWFWFSTVKIPFPIGIEYLIDKSYKDMADWFDTSSKWNVSPLITQPKAT